MVDNPVSPPAGVPERPPTTEPSPPSPSGEILAVPPRKSSRSKILLAVLSLLIILASLPIAVYLVKQRQEIRKEAGDTCPMDCGSIDNNIECWTHAGSGCAWQGDPYSGSCICTREETPTPPPPGPTSPPEGCSNQGQPCDKPGYPSVCCGSLVCDYNTCKPCSAFTDEARCWTHEKCYWFNGACRDRPSGTPPPDTGNITCSGSSVTNDTNQTLSCQASYFTCGVPKSSRAECEANPFCGGPSSSTSFTFAPGASKSFPDSSGIRCGVWQNDFIIDCGSGYSCSGGGHGCNWDESCEVTPTPTPTPTPGPLTCISLGGSPRPSSLSPGDEVTLTCTASSDPTVSINHFEFRVSSDSGTPVDLPSDENPTKTNNEYQGETTYTIPDYACYKVECRACTSSDSSQCTAWGQAQ